MAGINNFPPFFDFPNLIMEVNVDNNIFLDGRVCAWVEEVFYAELIVLLVGDDGAAECAQFLDSLKLGWCGLSDMFRRFI